MAVRSVCRALLLALLIAGAIPAGHGHSVRAAEPAVPRPLPQVFDAADLHPLRGSGTVLASPTDGASKLPAPAVGKENLAPAETERELHPGGQVRIIRSIVRDAGGTAILHGPWQWWDESGHLLASGNFQEGKRQGLWKRTHSRDDATSLRDELSEGFVPPFYSEAEFDRGLLHGTWTLRDSQGRMVFQTAYQEGWRHGRSTRWNPQGRKTQEIEFRSGLLEGDFVAWDGRGEELLRRNFHASRELLAACAGYSDGRRRSSITVLTAPLLPDGHDDWWNARRAAYRPSGQDERQGMALLWHANGQVMRQGDFDHDQPVGTHSWWFPNGQLAVRGDFREGSRHGEWTWWHGNGQILATGTYRYGDPAGLFVWRRNDGSVIAESAEVAAESPASQDRDAAPAPPRMNALPAATARRSAPR